MLALIVVVWGFLILTSGSDDGDGDDRASESPEDPTTTEPKRRTEPTRRAPRAPRSTTTTVNLVGQAPLLGEPTGYTVLLQSNGVQLLDVDSGVLRRLSGTAAIVGAVDGRLLVTNNNGEVEWWPSPYDGTDAEQIDTGDLNNGAWMDPAGSIIWVWRYDPFEDGASLRALTHDGDVVNEGPMPGDAYAVGALGDDLLVQAPGGSFLRRPDGSTSLLSTGAPAAVSDGRAVVNRCEDDLQCFTEVVERDGDVVAQYPSTGTTYYGGPYSTGAPVSPDGNLAQVVGAGNGGGELRIDGDVVPPVAETVDYNGSLAWSPDSRWLFVSTERGGLAAVDAATRTPVTLLEGRTQDPFWSILVLEGISLQP